MPFIIAFGKSSHIGECSKGINCTAKEKFQEFSKTCQKDILASTRIAVESNESTHATELSVDSPGISAM